MGGAIKAENTAQSQSKHDHRNRTNTGGREPLSPVFCVLSLYEMETHFALDSQVVRTGAGIQRLNS